MVWIPGWLFGCYFSSLLLLSCMAVCPSKVRAGVWRVAVDGRYLAPPEVGRVSGLVVFVWWMPSGAAGSVGTVMVPVIGGPALGVGNPWVCGVCGCRWSGFLFFGRARDCVSGGGAWTGASPPPLLFGCVWARRPLPFPASFWMVGGGDGVHRRSSRSLWRTSLPYVGSDDGGGVGLSSSGGGVISRHLPSSWVSRMSLVFWMALCSSCSISSGYSGIRAVVKSYHVAASDQYCL